MLKISQLLIKPFIFLAFLLVTSASHAADPTKGGELYAVHCADCHGASGISIMPDAPNFARNESLMKPDRHLLISINKGNNAMPSYQGILSDQDILDVIAYLRTLNQ